MYTVELYKDTPEIKTPLSSGQYIGIVCGLPPEMQILLYSCHKSARITV